MTGVTQVHIEFDGHLHQTSPDEDLTAFLHAFMDEFLALDGTDQGVHYDAGTGKVTFEVVVDGLDALDAVQKATTTVRAALHAAGAMTPGWPERERFVMAGVRVPVADLV